ncbi:MAG: cytochrome b/b6 domain-containing protein [Granulosicoccus sp.]|nr:cytochrome b/b6 domain-containing protein [Granulosicoccus sp.]
MSRAAPTMPERAHARYHGISIGLHWLIAILIIGMLVVGKVLENLDETDTLKFTLTQWHKSFGIVVLLLVIVRLVWRMGHTPPALPEHMKQWELTAAHLTHILLYALMIVIPLSGWIMVSASPLNLPTLLFNTIHWPHLPPFSSLENKEAISGLFHRIHAIAASIMILLLLAHIGAALRHHFLLRDGVMARMSPTQNGKWVDGIGRFAALTTLFVAGLFALVYSSQPSTPLSAGDSDVGFTFIMMGEENNGVFPDSEVELVYDTAKPEEGSLTATVKTATAATGDMQVDSSLSAPDWFGSTAFPEARFTSTEITTSSAEELTVKGMLTIKDISQEVEFPMTLSAGQEGRKATGGFTINRLDFDIGKTDQPDDATVGYNVVIQFSFKLE